MIIQNFDTRKRAFIIAEIGNNHEGRFDIAERLVQEAARTGVDAVKFQTYKTELFISPSETDRFKRLKSFELSQDQFRRLQQLAKSLGLLFISTPLDLQSAAFLEPLVDAFKVASGDNNYLGLFDVLCRTKKPVIVSMGLTSLSDVRSTYRYFRRQWVDRRIQQSLALMHCVSSYPVPDDQANLLSIPYLKKHFSCSIGYSDHTLGIDACQAAAALGAEIIEKHFTLDNHFSDFRDHLLSANPADMAQLVKNIRRIETLMGRPEKQIQPCEQANNPVIRRALVAAHPLREGQRLRSEDMRAVRPASRGLAPTIESRLLGRILARDIQTDEPLRLSDLKGKR